MDIIINSLYT
jgi:heat shock protein 90kDa beta